MKVKVQSNIWYDIFVQILNLFSCSCVSLLMKQCIIKMVKKIRMKWVETDYMYCFSHGLIKVWCCSKWMLSVMYTLNFHSVWLHFVNKFRNYKRCVIKKSKTSELNASDIQWLEINLAPVVQRLDNGIHRINHYAVDKC